MTESLRVENLADFYKEIAPAAKVIDASGDIYESSLNTPELLDLKKYLHAVGRTDYIKEGYEHWIEVELANQLYASPVPFIYNGNESYLVYGGLKVVPPTYTEEGKVYRLFPFNAKRRKMDYDLTVIAHPIVLDRNGEEIARGKARVMFRVADMVGCKFCNLASLSTREQYEEVGENVDNPGGQFIRSGTERVIPGADKMRLNQIFIQKQHKNFPHDHASQTFNVPSGTAVVRMIARKLFEKSKATACHLSVPKMKQSNTDSKKYKELNSINIFHLIDIVCHVYKRKDIVSSFDEYHVGFDKILEYICPEDLNLRKMQREQVKNRLLATVVEYKNTSFAKPLGELLEWLNVRNSPNDEKVRVVRELIERNIFPACNITLVEKEVEVEDNEGEVYTEVVKVYEGVEDLVSMICYMAARFLLFLTGNDTYSSKDVWGHKRVDTAHVSFSQLFWTEWDKACKDLTAELVKKGDDKKSFSSVDSFQSKLNTDKITKALLAPFNTRADEGTVGSAFIQSQQINPTNISDLISLLTKVQSKTQKTVGSFGVRAVQPSSFFYICPSENPEGGTCGTVRRMAMTSEVTVIRDYLKALALFKRLRLLSSTRTDEYCYPFVLNELTKHWCNGRDCYNRLMLTKRHAPWEFSISLEGPDDYVQSTEYEEYMFDLSDSLTDADDSPIYFNLKYPEYSHIFKEKLANISVGSYSTEQDDYPFPLYINDDGVGSCDLTFLKELIVLTIYTGKLMDICPKACITFNHRGHLEVYTDQGRLVRPVYIVDNDKVYAEDKELTIDLTFHEMVERGFIVYVDAYEEDVKDFVWSTDLESYHKELAKTDEVMERIDNIKYEIDSRGGDNVGELQTMLTHYEAELDRILKYPIKYVGLHGAAMYGTTAGIAPLTNYQTAAKSAHAAKINKQALSARPVPYTHTKSLSLAFGGTLPITVPSISTMVGGRRLPSSVTAVVAFFDDPNNQEDAIFISRNLITTGKIHFLKTFTVKGELETTGTRRLLGLPKNLKSGEKYLYRHLGSNGLPAPNSVLLPGDACIAIIEKGEVDINRTVFLKSDETGRVKDIIITTNKDTSGSTVTSYTVDILLEDFRVPEVGDKFSLPYGQKSVIGIIVDPEDMIFSSDAGAYVSVEVAFNSHAIKNRMTLGLLFEQLMGSAAAAAGMCVDTTSFLSFDDEKFKSILRTSGYNPKGTYAFFSGRTGIMLHGDVYAGPLYFQQLHHVASESVHAKATAERDVVTKEVRKAKKEGGQRAGEQEKSAMIAHQAHHIFEEKFRIYSDNYVTAWCSSCNLPSPVSSGECRYCKAVDSFMVVQMPYSYKRASEYSMSMGIRIYSVIVDQDTYAENYISSMSKMNETHEYVSEEEVDSEEEEEDF